MIQKQNISTMIDQPTRHGRMTRPLRPDTGEQGGASMTLAPGVYEQDMVAHLPGHDQGLPGASMITVDAQAVKTAAASLHKTLQRCEDERAKLTSLVQTARQVGRQHEQAAESSPPAALTPDQVAQVPALDAWISGRLNELHAVDHALGLRQEKLEKLEVSLGKLAQGLSGQIQQMSQAKAQLEETHGSIDVRLARAVERLDQQMLVIEQRVVDHVQRMNQAQTSVEANLAQVQATGQAAMTSLHTEFEALVKTIAGRLQEVRKPVHRWLQQHLAQYETMLNERIDQAHLPVARRIEDIQAQATVAMTESLQALDGQMSQLFEPIKAEFETRQQALLAQAAGVLSRLDEQWIHDRQALEDRCEQRVQEVIAGHQRVVEEALTDLNERLDEGLENIGGKSRAIGEWFAHRRKTMSRQMEELQVEAIAALEQAQRIIEYGRQGLHP